MKMIRFSEMDLKKKLIISLLSFVFYAYDHVLYTFFDF